MFFEPLTLYSLLYCWHGKQTYNDMGCSVCLSLFMALFMNGPLVHMWEAICIGAMAGLITFIGLLIIERTQIDDPCGAFIVHGMNGIWGLIAVGIFAKTDFGFDKIDYDLMEYPGLLYGGGYY